MTAAAGPELDDAGSLRMQVADEVRAWLARRRMSGAQLARVMGKSQTFVARRLDGRQAFDMDDLEAVARILDITPMELLGGAPFRPNAPQISSTFRATNRRYPSDNQPVLRLVQGALTTSDQRLDGVDVTPRRVA